MTRRQRLLWSALAGAVLAAAALPLAAGLRADPPQRAAATGPATEVRDDAAPRLLGATLAGGRFDLAAWHGNVAGHVRDEGREAMMTGANAARLSVASALQRRAHHGTFDGYTRADNGVWTVPEGGYGNRA